MKPNQESIRVAIYARVSGDRQAEEGTIASQVEELQERLRREGLTLDPELCFLDDGYCGATFLRPGLERLRDQAAAAPLIAFMSTVPIGWLANMLIRCCWSRNCSAPV